MGNPYPIEIGDADGVARLQGEATFTDPGNQPGGGGSQPSIERIDLALSFDTPGLVIPASGPAGIKVCDLNPGDFLVASWGSGTITTPHALGIVTVWDGTTPVLKYTLGTGDEGYNRGDLPGTAPGFFASQPLSSGAGALANEDYATGGTFTINQGTPLASDGATLFSIANSLYVYVDDGAGNDPVSTQGQAILSVFVARVPA